MTDENHEYFEMGLVNESGESKLDETEFFNLKNMAKNRIPDAERTTRRYITKYEKAKIIGVRAQQIALGAVPNIDIKSTMTPREIARYELENKKTPIIVQRIFHTGKYEEWKIEELI